MTGIQLLLISGAIFILFYYAFRLRSALLDFLVVFIFCGLAIFFILFPDTTSVIANQLGVGRGADLLFYSCILFFLFIIMKLFARIRRLEKTLTDYIRRQAHSEALSLSEEANRNKSLNEKNIPKP